ncbi:hypothetical protein [Pseudarthrobacter sp. H2]|uniref:hypothetical protein n=1 Tax=Pseudarthrobacter sp. H2 TaxID=3418415 RepID=UPI003CF868C5
MTVSAATTKSIAQLREYLVAQQVTLAVTEAAGDYWKPFRFILDPELDVMLVNARHARNLPDRKTDVSPTRNGSPSWAPTGSCADPLSDRSTSVSCVTSPSAVSYEPS